METAKVDVRKLQMLNDRINQTIDALNQVRLSVHGMSPNGTTTNGINSPFAQAGFPTQFGNAGFPYGVPGVNAIGFGHTGFPMNVGGFGIPQNQAWAQQQNPWAQQNGLGLGLNLGNILGQTGFGTQTGFAHSPEAVDFYTRRGVSTTDPFVASRIAATFPFVQWGYSPLASGYSPFASATY